MLIASGTRLDEAFNYLKRAITDKAYSDFDTRFPLTLKQFGRMIYERFFVMC